MLPSCDVKRSRVETIVLTLGTAAMIGALHAFEADHMLAVTTFVSRRPALGEAVRFGARWGIGHSLAVLALGGLVVLAGLRWPERYDAVAEAAVGVMLAGLGLWALVSARKLHLHTAEEHGGHAHLHVHAAAARHDHGHHRGHEHGRLRAHGGITLVGLLHGLAGTGGVVALLPVTLIENRALGVGYLAAFGVGVTLGMTLFALVAAAVMREANHRSLVWGRRASMLVGVAGMLVGAWWVWRALVP
jgi:ABC-type nickel/cobalt efflux system permease component RcnA